MLTKNQNIVYARQIAELFCESGGALCIASVKNRIVNGFNDAIFENKFLPGLDTAIYRAVTGTFKISSPGYVKFVATTTDIVNGKKKDMLIDGIPGNKVGNWTWIIGHLNDYYRQVAPNLHASHLGIVNNKLIWAIDGVSSPYGIVFVPGSVGSGTGSGTCPEGQVWFGGKCVSSNGGGIIVDPGDPAIGMDPVIQQEVESDFTGIFSNPLVLIAGVGLVFFYLMNE